MQGDSMVKRLYVGNFPMETTENELQDLFKQVGSVQEVHLVQDRATGKSRGFAFIEMGSPEEAMRAIEELHGKDYNGRRLTVNEARPRATSEDSGGYRERQTGYGAGRPRSNMGRRAV